MPWPKPFRAGRGTSPGGRHRPFAISTKGDLQTGPVVVPVFDRGEGRANQGCDRRIISTMNDQWAGGTAARAEDDPREPFRFWGKTWIIVAGAIVCGGFALFCLALGPLFLFGVIKPANGGPAKDAGIALCVMSVPALLICALAVSKLRVRRRPLLQLFREGIELVEPERAPLEGVPLVPWFVWLALSIVSGSGFRHRTLWVSWEYVQGAVCSGRPMDRFLTINLLLPLRQSGRRAAGRGNPGRVVLNSSDHPAAVPLRHAAG